MVQWLPALCVSALQSLAATLPQLSDQRLQPGGDIYTTDMGKCSRQRDLPLLCPSEIYC